MEKRTCPGDEQLRQFDSGALPREQAESVAEHLEACQICCDRVAQIAPPRLFAFGGPGPELQYCHEHAYQQLESSLFKIGVFQREDRGDATLPVTEIVPQQLREYCLLEKIGAGGMGTVYKARHTKLDRLAAINVLPAHRTQDPAAVLRFEREMRTIAMLDHPHIVRALDAGEVDGVHFLVMEYASGLDLSELMCRHGPLSIGNACELVRQAACGLQAAHVHGIVHRDIKPSNLMLTVVSPQEFSTHQSDPSGGSHPARRAIVKILDLGLAFLGDLHGAADARVTQTSQIMGTLDYLAPEQAGDSRNVDIRADIYSLGVTLYRLLSDHVLFEGEAYQSALHKLMAIALGYGRDAVARADRGPRFRYVRDRRGHLTATHQQYRFDINGAVAPVTNREQPRMVQLAVDATAQQPKLTVTSNGQRVLEWQGNLEQIESPFASWKEAGYLGMEKLELPGAVACLTAADTEIRSIRLKLLDGTATLLRLATELPGTSP